MTNLIESNQLRMALYLQYNKGTNFHNTVPKYISLMTIQIFSANTGADTGNKDKFVMLFLIFLYLGILVIKCSSFHKNKQYCFTFN